MKFFLILTLITFSIACKEPYKENKLVISPLHPYADKDKWLENDSLITKYYFIDGFKSYKQDSSIIDQFVKNSIDSNYANFYYFDIIFYKKDEHINSNFRSSEADNVNSVNCLLNYKWRKGQFLYCLDNSTSPITTYFKKGNKIFNSTTPLNSYQDYTITDSSINANQ